MTKDEARSIISTLQGWNVDQKSTSLIFHGTRDAADDVYDARRATLAKAWRVLCEQEPAA